MTVDRNDQRRADARGWGSGGPDSDGSSWRSLEIMSMAGRQIKVPSHRLQEGRGEYSFSPAN
jgi:hypothetical protein